MNLNNLQRNIRVLIVIFGVACLLVYLAIFSRHVYDQVFWKNYFQVKHPIGNYCEVEVLSHNKGFIPMNMPHRGNPNAPLVFGNDQLTTRCEVDFKDVTKDEFAWIFLGKVFGKFEVYLDNNTIVASKNQTGELVEFPVPMDVRGKSVELKIVSTGTTSGSSGLATLVPPFFTTDLNELKVVRRFLYSANMEQNLTHTITAFILFLFLTGVLFSGKSYKDLIWLVIIAGSTCLLSGFRYFKQFDNPLLSQSILNRLSSCLYFLIMIGYACFLAALTRRQQLISKAEKTLLTIGTLFTIAALFVNDALFLNWKLLVLTPAMLGVCLIAVLLLILVRIYQTEAVSYALPRLRLAIGLAVFAIVVLGLQTVFDHKYGIYIDSLANNIILLVFAGIALRDLLIRQKGFYTEQAARISKEKELLESMTVIKTTQYLAHDMMKPFNLVDMFLKGFTDVSREDLLEYCKQFAKSMTVARADADKLFLDLMQGNKYPVGSEIVSELEQEVNSVLKTQQVVFSNNHIEVVNSIDEGVRVYIDPLILRRIITNLVENAVKAMKANQMPGRLIRLSATVNEGFVKLAVFNSNSRIPQELKTAIFELGRTNDIHGQHGVGLAFVKASCIEAGGDVDFKSDHLGVTFYVSLKQVSTGNMSLATSTKNEMPHHQKPTVCVIDDDEFVLFQWRKFAGKSNSGFQLDTFTHPKDFVTRVRNFEHYLNTVEFVFLDEVFSGDPRGGFSYLEELSLSGKFPKVVLTSSLAQEFKQGSNFVLGTKDPKTLQELREIYAQSSL